VHENIDRSAFASQKKKHNKKRKINEISALYTKCLINHYMTECAFNFELLLRIYHRFIYDFQIILRLLYKWK